MPKWSLKNSEQGLYKHSLEDRVEMIDSKLDLLQKIKSTGCGNHLLDYYMQEFNKMRKKVHTYLNAYPIYIYAKFF